MAAPLSQGHHPPQGDTILPRDTILPVTTTALGHNNAKGTPGNGSKATKVKNLRRHPATKHLVTKKALEGATEAHSSARQVNKPVYVSSKEAMEGDVANFTFYNENHKIFPEEP